MKRKKERKKARDEIKAKGRGIVAKAMMKGVGVMAKKCGKSDVKDAWERTVAKIPYFLY